MKTKIRSILFEYMWYDVHVESLLNIRRSCKNLAAMGMTEKNHFLGEFSRYLYKTEWQDIFYSLLKGNWTVLYPALSIPSIFFGNKVGRVFVTKFFQDKRANNFLKYLEYIEECEPDNVRCECPKVRRKYYKYKNSNSGS